MRNGQLTRPERDLMVETVEERQASSLDRRWCAALGLTALAALAVRLAYVAIHDYDPNTTDAN